MRIQDLLYCALFDAAVSVETQLTSTFARDSTCWRTKMATSGNMYPQVWAWRDLYLTALMEVDKDNTPARIVDAEQAILNRARELFKASGDNIQEEEALDDALYALRALKNCLEIRGGPQ